MKMFHGVKLSYNLYLIVNGCLWNYKKPQDISKRAAPIPRMTKLNRNVFLCGMECNTALSTIAKVKTSGWQNGNVSISK